MTGKKKDYLFDWNDEDHSDMLRALQKDFKIDLTNAEIKRSQQQITVETQSDKIILTYDKQKVIARSDATGKEKTYTVIKEKGKTGVYDCRIFEYEKDREEYMRALDTCIEFYKTKNNSNTIAVIALLISTAAFFVSVMSPYLTNSLTSCAKSIPMINLCDYATFVLIGNFILMIAAIFIICLFLYRPSKEVEKLLNPLYLARLNPTRWRLLVAFSVCDGVGSIRNVKLEYVDEGEEDG